jgi:hypothetical protein
MKIFAMIFFTFSGICEVYSQKPADNFQTDSTGSTAIINAGIPVKDPGMENESPGIHLFPNPALNKIAIEISGFDPGFVQVQIFNMDGRLVRNEKRLVFAGHESIIMMFSINTGIYMLFVKQDNKWARSRLVIR